MIENRKSEKINSVTLGLYRRDSSTKILLYKSQQILLLVNKF